MKKLGLLLLAVLVFMGANAWAMERFEIVTTEEMHAMLQEREAGKIDFLLVNTLDELLFRSQSIPGSINVPWADVEGTAHRLGKDWNRLIVVYCKGYR